ncbi:MAG: hypothetical protein VX028_03800 [Nanoarchaeota archaeon]|nr:hypothetical protein [Nanoarchaeota archaeon]MEC8339357.1 hypothetical protein [Nanoarchaeota archaeon]
MIIKLKKETVNNFYIIEDQNKLEFITKKFIGENPNFQPQISQDPYLFNKSEFSLLPGATKNIGSESINLGGFSAESLANYFKPDASVDILALIDSNNTSLRISYFIRN